MLEINQDLKLQQLKEDYNKKIQQLELLNNKINEYTEVKDGTLSNLRNLQEKQNKSIDQLNRDPEQNFIVEEYAKLQENLDKLHQYHVSQIEKLKNFHTLSGQTNVEMNPIKLKNTYDIQKITGLLKNLQDQQNQINYLRENIRKKKLFYNNLLIENKKIIDQINKLNEDFQRAQRLHDQLNKKKEILLKHQEFKNDFEKIKQKYNNALQQLNDYYKCNIGKFSNEDDEKIHQYLDIDPETFIENKDVDLRNLRDQLYFQSINEKKKREDEAKAIKKFLQKILEISLH